MYCVSVENKMTVTLLTRKEFENLIHENHEYVKQFRVRKIFSKPDFDSVGDGVGFRSQMQVSSEISSEYLRGTYASCRYPLLV